MNGLVGSNAVDRSATLCPLCDLHVPNSPFPDRPNGLSPVCPFQWIPGRKQAEHDSVMDKERYSESCSAYPMSVEDIFDDCHLTPPGLTARPSSEQRRDEIAVLHRSSTLAVTLWPLTQINAPAPPNWSIAVGRASICRAAQVGTVPLS